LPPPAGRWVPTESPTNPRFVVDEGVITGENPNGATNLTYTVVRDPSGGGKIVLDKTTGTFSYLPYSTGTNADYSQNFATSEDVKILVAENTAFDQALENLPVVGALAEPLLVRIHRVPILGDALSPIIGQAEVVTVTIYDQDLAASAPGPIAFTTTVISDKKSTPISVNWFPSIGVAAGTQEDAPTILNGPSLATAGYIDPNQTDTVFGLVPGLYLLRDDYNVVTWDPRGEFASGGVLHLDSPNYEAVDVSSIITWVTTQGATRYDTVLDGNPDSKDPLIGMVGGSYGGGIQLTSAGIDPRIDVIAPGIAWNNLYDTLYPNHGFKTAFASLLLLSLVVSGSRIDPVIYSGIATGAVLGILTPGQKRFLEAASPSNVVEQIDIPVLFLQGTVDVLFPLQQAVTNAESVSGQPVKMIWYCGGHGQCLDPIDPTKQTDFLTGQTMDWMDTYLLGKPNEIPTFQWVDQKGDIYKSDFLPTKDSPLFSDTPIETEAVGLGTLVIAPLLGGSGPNSSASFPVSLATASEARNAINVDIPNPTGSGAGQDPTAWVVGSPTLTLTYSGVGTSRNVYAQIVDKNTGRVVGNILTPIPVVLDGKTHTTEPISMEDIAYTMEPGDDLELQIVGTATPFENFTSYGVINVQKVELSLPTADADEVEFETSVRGTGAPASSGGLLGI
jgi:ABC-2 type transport system ATP-binding protein